MSGFRKQGCCEGPEGWWFVIIIQESVDGNACPGIPSIWPVSGWEGSSNHFFSFYFFPSDPEDSRRRIPPWLPARARSGAAFLSVSPRGLRLRSAISLATRSAPAAHNHTAPGSCSSICRQLSLDENFQNALLRPQRTQKTYRSC